MIKVVYNEKQVADAGDQPLAKRGMTASPSARKPKELAKALKAFADIEFVEPEALCDSDFKLCHDPQYVDDVLNLRTENGFGTISQSVVDSLPYTNGAMYTAARLATKDQPTAALVSGFHHACYAGWKGNGWFCTFNGLTITAAKLIQEGKKRICILDCDMHWGNGTDNILETAQFLSSGPPDFPGGVDHLSFGKYFHSPSDAKTYLEWIDTKVVELFTNRPDVVLYQAGADVHVNDPYGGVLTTEQMFERDLKVFRYAKQFEVPIAWNLAGGYQIDADGSIQKVLDLHLGTFEACRQIYT